MTNTDWIVIATAVVLFIMLLRVFAEIRWVRIFLVEQFDALRRYLYEIDPQFDEERALESEFEDARAKGQMTLLGSAHLDLIKQKQKEGKRTLNSPL